MLNRRQIIGVAIAVAYLCALVAMYCYIPFGDPGYEYGGLRLLLYTLPLSLVGQLFTAIGLIAPNLIGEFVSFFVFVVLCGGANAYVIARVFRYQPDRRTIRTALGLGLLVGIAAQATAPYRFAAARRYHWPKNVPKAAVVVPHWSGGWYQTCEFNTASDRNHCRIWNFGGSLLYDEEFIPCGGGSPVQTEHLNIVDRNSGPDRVTLQNGKILVPVSRANDRNYLDHVCTTPKVN